MSPLLVPIEQFLTLGAIGGCMRLKGRCEAYHRAMNRIRPQWPESAPSDRAVAAEVLLREEPDEEEDEGEDKGDGKDDDDDDDQGDEDDEGYSE